ncbi:TIGR03086 family metal-binding protein [Catenuloplanes sp. NPDC051500]|uniref:TIGR03086 family metal-binding protein n=1 Tax=Catenuloplanes sp. NPDC051500 TaxID=3363959 RepID=UPI0037B763ED
MQLHAVLVRAFAGTAAVVRGVTPEQLGAATPCADWNVRALTNHVLQVGSALRLAGRRAPFPDDLWTRDLIGADGPADRFEDDRRDALEAWSEPAAWDGKIDMGAPMTAPEAVTMLVSDLALHGWDLAQATGQEYLCDPAVAAVTRDFVAASGEQGRQMGIFGPALPVADGADVFDEALALSGRARR